MSGTIGGWASCTCFALVPLDFAVEAAFYHAKEHRLNSAVELMIFGALVGSLDVCENGMPDRGSERRRGRPWEKRKESFQEAMWE